MKDHPRVILLGLMGCGKSTVGRALAKKLGWKYLDTDAWIQRQSGKSVSALFASEGEASFRRWESRALAHALRQKRCVVAAGGGMVVLPANRRALFSGARTAYLRLSPEQAFRRLKKSGLAKRPLLQGGKALKVLRQLAEQRRPWYSRAEITVSALGNPASVAHRIATRLCLD